MQHSEFYRPASENRENSRSPISKALVNQWQSLLRTAGITDHKKIELICNRAKAILLIQGEENDSSILLQAAQNIHEDETSKIRISSDSAAAVTLFATLFSDYVTRPSITEKEVEIPGGAKPTRASVHKAKRERRFDLVCEHYVAKKNQVPPSITSAADFFADSIGISRRQAKSLIYGTLV